MICREMITRNNPNASSKPDPTTTIAKLPGGGEKICQMKSAREKKMNGYEVILRLFSGLA